MADVSKIKLPDNTVLDIKDDRMGNARIFYGTCSTAGATVAKAVVCPDFTSAELKKAALIFVTFSDNNSGAVADLTMNVNSTGAKPLKKQTNTSSSANLSAVGELKANSTYLFQYDGTNWICMTLDYNSTYSALTEADMKAGTATTGRTITAARVKQAVEYWMVENQIDWNETDPTSPSYIANKPSIGGAGTLDTTATTAQSTSSSESLGGSVTLHKVAKTGTYSDLIGTPSVPSASSTIPAMDGTASAGSETAFARGDHVHPSDSSKQDTLTWDTAPTASSTNPVTSGGLYTTLGDYLKYVYCASESDYTNIQNKDAGTLYLIQET